MYWCNEVRCKDLASFKDFSLYDCMNANNVIEGRVPIIKDPYKRKHCALFIADSLIGGKYEKTN